MFINTTFNI